MPAIFFNREKAREHLLDYSFVYILRKKKGLEQEFTAALKGSIPQVELIGKVKVQWFRTIDRKDALRPYVFHSGFDSIDEWIEQSGGEATELYRVDLISKPPE